MKGRCGDSYYNCISIHIGMDIMNNRKDDAAPKGVPIRFEWSKDQ
jgi:hypothetical protein